MLLKILQYQFYENSSGDSRPAHAYGRTDGQGEVY
jgi:hypothetical protein